MQPEVTGASTTMAYRYTGVLIVVSAVALAVGLFRAAKTHRWGLFAGTVIFVAGYPLLLAAIFQITDKHFGGWVLIAALMFFPAWIISGIAVLGITERSPDQWFGQGAQPPSTRIRYQGLAVLTVGIIAWCVGAFNPELSMNVQLLLLAIACYCLLFGFVWAIGGRGINGG